MIGKSIAPQANIPTGMTSSVLLSALWKLQKTAPATDIHFHPLFYPLKFCQNSPLWSYVMNWIKEWTQLREKKERKKEKHKSNIFHRVSSLTHITTPGNTQNKNHTSPGTSKGAGHRQKEAAESNSSSY